jgi:hypothetical protein
VSHVNVTLAILLAQSLSLIACTLFAVWCVVPWLESRSQTEALVPPRMGARHAKLCTAVLRALYVGRLVIHAGCGKKPCADRGHCGKRHGAPRQTAAEVATHSPARLSAGSVLAATR